VPLGTEIDGAEPALGEPTDVGGSVPVVGAIVDGLLANASSDGEAVTLPPASGLPPPESQPATRSSPTTASAAVRRLTLRGRAQ
jgi:hypothetical protein